jgi:hypothetical protein
MMTALKTSLKTRLNRRLAPIALLPMVLIAALAGPLAAPVVPGRAQARPSVWTTPVNVSLSGGATTPLVAMAPNAGVYAIWWDVVDGVKLSRGVYSETNVLWQPPVNAPGINGGIDKSITTRVVQLPPADPRFLIVTDTVGHLVYQNADQQLLYSRLLANRLTPPVPLARDVLVYDASLDLSGTLQLAYTVINTRTQPTGIYYSRRGAVPFAAPVVISPYFRTVKTGDVRLSVASDRGANVVLTWFQANADQSQYVRSTNGGRTWSKPLPIVERGERIGVASHTSVTYTPSGEFLLLWRDSSAPGCGFTQRRSADGGETWSQPERVLGEMTVCPDSWRFVLEDNAVMMLGTPARAPGSDTSMVFARWEGSNWLQPVMLDFGTSDPVNKSTRALACIDAAVAAGRMALIGCDARRDAFVSLNAVPLRDLLPALASPWSAPATLSRLEDHVRAIAALSNPDGDVIGTWTSARAADLASGARMALALYTQGNWQPAQIVLAAAAGNREGPASVNIDGPALAFDADRVHAVWRGGESGQVFYSRAFQRELTSADGWAQPQALAPANPVGGSPAIVADARGQLLYVAYPVAYNEGRGVFLTTSSDGGTTWSPPTTIFDAASAGWTGVDDVQLALDVSTGSLHAAWMRLGAADASGNRGLHYSRSSDGGRTWSAPLDIATGAVSAPRLVAAPNGVLSLVWLRVRGRIESQAAPYEVWSQFSPDAGESWSSRGPVSGFGEVSGPVSHISGADGQLYLGAIGLNANGESVLLTASWEGAKWGAAESLSLRQPGSEGNTVALVVSGKSKVLLALMRIDVLQSNGRLRPELRSLSRPIEMNAPLPVPTFTPAPTIAPTATPQGVVEPTPTATLQPISTSAPVNSQIEDGNQLLYGVIATVVALAVALLVFSFVRRR